MAKIADVQEVSLEKLRPYERNAKKHGPGQVEKLKASIMEFGFLTPCLIDSDYNLIAGHGRVMAAKELGIKTVPCVFIEGLTDEQRRAYILADNRLGELGEWDMELVSQEVEWLRGEGFDIDVTGFTADDILFDEIDFGLDEEPEPEPPAEAITKTGDIWQLGDHRLICGDSTRPEDLAALMQGDRADLLITDPPYNVALGVGDTPEVAKARRRRTDGLKIENDAMSAEEFEDFIFNAFSIAAGHMKEGAAYYCWYASTSQKSTQTALEKAGLPPRQILIWVKNALVLGRQDYQWRHEPCFYGWKEGAAHYFIDARSLTTIFDDLDSITRDEAIDRLKEYSATTSAIYEDRPNRSPLHPTMKPLGLFKKQIRNSSKEGDIVLDIFGGSGTTLIACEEMGRRCRIVEYDPFYATAIIRRWEEQTGRKAEKV